MTPEISFKYAARKPENNLLHRGFTLGRAETSTYEQLMALPIKLEAIITLAAIVSARDNTGW